MKCDVVDLSAKKGFDRPRQGVFGVDIQRGFIGSRGKVAIIAPTSRNSQDKTAQ